MSAIGGELSAPNKKRTSVYNVIFMAILQRASDLPCEFPCDAFP